MASADLEQPPVVTDVSQREQRLLTALTTEHFTLQGARAQTLAES